MARATSSRDVPVLVSADGGIYEEDRKRIITACRMGKEQDLTEALEKVKGESDTFLNVRYRDETTPLHVACSYGNVDCISLLLRSGADANIYDSRGFAPIHCAAYRDHKEAIRTLLLHDPLTPDTTAKCTPDQESEFKETPLHVACLMGSINAAIFLQRQDASLDSVDVERNTLLHSVSCSDNAEMWRWAKLNLLHLVEEKNIHGQTPAHLAASLGCPISISALTEMKAKFDETKDGNDLSATDVMDRYGNTRCYDIATGRQLPILIPPPSVTTRTAVGRTLSNGSVTSPKLRRSSITGLDRPKNVALSSSASASLGHFESLRRRPSNMSQKSTTSYDSFISVSNEDAAKVHSRLSRLNSANSEDKINVIYDQTAFEPPPDLVTIAPIYRETIDHSRHIIFCQEHGIQFITNHFVKKDKNYTKKSDVSQISVCIAAAMHLNVTFPQNYTIVSPICFLSCKYKKPLQVTLTLPHAVSLSSIDKMDKKMFSILSIRATSSLESPLFESPPMERGLLPISVDDSFLVESIKVTFKTTVSYPSLFAVGIKNGKNRIPRPFLPLKCRLFCMYEDYNERSMISTIPIRIHVGLNLGTVTRIMDIEGEQSHSKYVDTPFIMSDENISLQASLKNSRGEWTLDDATPQLVSYTEVALTEDTDDYSYSHRLSYPPHRIVNILPMRDRTSSAVQFELVIKDPGLKCIKNLHFIPYAPWKSTTVTPCGTPPPAHPPKFFVSPDSPGSSQSSSSSLTKRTQPLASSSGSQDIDANHVATAPSKIATLNNSTEDVLYTTLV